MSRFRVASIDLNFPTENLKELDISQNEQNVDKSYAGSLIN